MVGILDIQGLTLMININGLFFPFGRFYGCPTFDERTRYAVLARDDFISFVVKIPDLA